MIIRTKENEYGNLPTSARFADYTMPFNIAAEQQYGRVVNGRLIGPYGEILRGGLIADAEYIRTTRNGVTYNVRLRALSGSPAARQSVSGRNGPWACWHSVYAYLEALYAEFPEAVVRSAFITYRGAEEFEANAAKTFYHRVGGELSRMRFGELCHPLGWHDWHDAPDRRLSDGTDLMAR